MGKGEQWPPLQMTKIPLRWWRWIKQVNIILLIWIIRGAADRPSHLQVAWGTRPKASLLPAEDSYFKCWLQLSKVSRRKKGQTRIFQVWLNRRKKLHSSRLWAPLTHLANRLSKASQLTIYANIFKSTEHIPVRVKTKTSQHIPSQKHLLQQTTAFNTPRSRPDQVYPPSFRRASAK